MELKIYHLFLLPLEDIHLGYCERQGMLIPTWEYIPGRVVRGSLAGWAIRNGFIKSDLSEGSLFNKIFTDTISEYDISFPFCYQNGRLPAPLSLFEAKGFAGNPRILDPAKNIDGYRKINKDRNVFNDKSRSAEEPADFLKREDVQPSKIEKYVMRVVKGTIDEDGDKLYPAISKTVELRAPHDEVTGTIRKGEAAGGLFAEEQLPGSTVVESDGKRLVVNYYYGRLVFNLSTELEEIFDRLCQSKFGRYPDVNWELVIEHFKNPDFSNLVFLGRRRLPVFIFSLEPEVISSEKLQAETNKWFDHQKSDGTNEVSISFTSDLLIHNKSNFIDPYPLTAEKIRVLFNLKEVHKKSVFCSYGQIYGFDTMETEGEVIDDNNRLKGVKPLAPVIKAGSCGLFGIKVSREQALDIQKKSLMGIGADTKNGFGRYIVNWGVHKVKESD